MTLRQSLESFYAFLDRPLYLPARLVLAALVIPLCLTFTSPLWRISMVAPQYPNGLYIDIYTHKVEGGHEGRVPPGWFSVLIPGDRGSNGC